MVGDAQAIFRKACTCGAAVLLAALALACSDAHSNEPAQKPVMDAGARGDAGRDAAAAVKERTVSIELFPTAHREIRVGDDGEPVYGEITPLAGVRVCVKQRRDAFALFQRFEELEEPLCVMSEEGQFVRIDNVPANSDLVTTFTKEGYVPQAGTYRTDDYDVAAPRWGGNVFSTLAKLGDWAPWIEPAPAAPAAIEDAGLVAVEVAMVWLGPGDLVTDAEEREFWWGSHPWAYRGRGADVRIERQGAGEAIELRTLARRPYFLWLSKGSYRMTFDHPNVPPCQPTGVDFRFPTLGLPVDAPEALERPVVPGHLNWAQAICPCSPPESRDQKLVDITTCTFEGADAGN